MTTVFVSGCYDVLHGGHIEFLQAARALGDRLVVCLPSDEVVMRHRGRFPALPSDQKVVIFSALRCVDEVLVGEDEELGLNFKTHFLRLRPEILAAGADDKYESEKRALCAQVGARYVKAPRSISWPDFSSSQLVARMRAPLEVPLRVDFAGGWLDVPKLARQDAYIVNCTISPMIGARNSIYHSRAGLGGSAAYSILEGRDGVESELALGVGWQDPAVIKETGLCVWRSGRAPSLDFKTNPMRLLAQKMCLWWTGAPHDTPGLVDGQRNYDMIEQAGRLARRAAYENDYLLLCRAVQQSYAAQQDEGMQRLPDCGERAKKYCGGGWGGYAVYLFASAAKREEFLSHQSEAIAIEPFMRFA